jgi:hypothetical protein
VLRKGRQFRLLRKCVAVVTAFAATTLDAQEVKKPLDSAPEVAPAVRQLDRRTLIETLDILSEEAFRRGFENSRWLEAIVLGSKTTELLPEFPSIGPDVVASQASMVFAIVDKSSLDEGKEPADFTTISFEGKYARYKRPLCHTADGWQAYQGQPAGVLCTGFVVNGTHLVTAAHCLSKDGAAIAAQRLASLRFVRRYWLGPKSDPPVIPRSEIYAPRAQSLNDRYHYDSRSQIDWVVIELDRKVEGPAPLELTAGVEFSSDDRYYTFGFPFGLPMKFAYNGIPAPVGVSQGLASIKLSVFGGDSGAPIMNSNTGKVSGMLIDVRDEEDNVQKVQSSPECYEPTHCAPGISCLGEVVLPIRAIPGKLLGGA